MTNSQCGWSSVIILCFRRDFLFIYYFVFMSCASSVRSSIIKNKKCASTVIFYLFKKDGEATSSVAYCAFWIIPYYCVLFLYAQNAPRNPFVHTCHSFYLFLCSALPTARTFTHDAIRTRACKHVSVYLWFFSFQLVRARRNFTINKFSWIIAKEEISRTHFCRNQEKRYRRKKSR